jgi:hypothetical protein
MFRIAIIVALVIGITNSSAHAQTPTQSLYSTIFGVNAAPKIYRVVVSRIDPNIERTLAPTAKLVDINKWEGDASARFQDRDGIESLVAILKSNDTTRGERYCKQGDADRFVFGWMIYFYSLASDGIYDRKQELGSIFISPDGTCAWTHGQVYAIDPTGLARYLMRSFSFMDF